MNTRSIQFRLTVWYAGLLALLLLLFGASTYLGLRHYLNQTLNESLGRQAQQIGESFLVDVATGGEGYVISEINEHYAPELNNRFVRLTRANGSVLYVSGKPKESRFDPSAVAAVGAPVEQVEVVLYGLLLALALGLPLTVIVAISGGWLLMRQALNPVDEITRGAEQITSRNLSQRLPVARTGDELERLSAALNRMIERLEESFLYVSRFTADASHELRTPLTILRGELEAAV